MNKISKLLLLTTLINFGFAQQIAIPFRAGNKWGICDENATLLIEPKFDNVSFFENYYTNYQVLFSKVKNKKGLIIDGVEILLPIYDMIYEKAGNYTCVKTENNVKTTSIISSKGKSIFAEPFLEVVVNENFSDRFELYHVINLDKTESAFIFDPRTNVVSQWLYENYYSLDLLKMKSMQAISFKVKKNENDGLILESWDFSKLPSTLKKGAVVGKSETDIMYEFSKKTAGKNEKYGNSGNQGLSYGETDYYSPVVVESEIRGDNDGSLSISGPQENVTKPVKQPIYISNSFKIENDKLVLLQQNQYDSKAPKITIPVKLNIPIKDIEIVGYALQEKRNDTTFYYNNTVLYKKKNKKGFLYSADVRNLVEFDSITKNVYALSDDKNGSDLVFIVANRDIKNKAFKYGFYSFKKKLITPTIYDQLTPTVVNFANGIKTFIVQENDKFGIITNDGTQILNTTYDEIKQVETSRSSDKILQIKKGTKYNFITQKQGEVANNNLVSFDYPIKNSIYNYPQYSYKTNKEAGVTLKTTTIYELVDENKKLIGYANSNGILYYKN